MIDWATTKLFITGSATEIQQFRSDCIKDYLDDGYEDTRLDFEALVPTPAVFLKHFEDLDNRISSVPPLVDGLNWYDWRRKFWGTKWNSHALQEISFNNEFYQCIFDTPWCCPGPIIAAIAKKYPSFEGTTETSDWSDMTMHVGSFANGVFLENQEEYELEDESEELEDDELDDEAAKVEPL